MLLQSIVTSAAIFALLAGWVTIDRLARQTGLAKSYTCSEDESHCHHCDMADNCTQRHDH